MKTKKNILLIMMMFIGSFISAQTQTKIPKDSLPASVKEHLHSKFHDYSVANVVKLADKNGIITYKLEAKRAKNSNENIIYDIVYDAQGKLISKKKEKEFFYTDSPKPKPKPTESNDGHGGHQH